MIQALKGMKDIYNNDIEKFDFIIDTATKVFSKYSYTHIITPLVEEVELFKRSVGDETDVVSKEMYNFVDKGDRSIALRPEGTAGVVRAYLQAKLYNNNPITKWFYFGPMYRYEAPQKGRYREFNQVGVEAFGIRNPLFDAELISMACDFLNELGINNLVVEINSLANKSSREKYINALKEYLLENFDKLSEVSKIRCNKNPLRVLDSKDDDEIVKNAPNMYDFFDDESKIYFEKVLYYLDKFNINYIVNNKLVRGLDYYSDTVFEIKSNDIGAKSTILGGGRYDKLIDILAGKDIPAIGFAAGIERISMLINDSKINRNKKKVFVMYFEETKDYLFNVLKELKKLDVEIHYEYEIKSFNYQIKKANKLNVDKLIIIGEDELKSNRISIKDFKTAEQKTINLENLKEEINV